MSTNHQGAEEAGKKRQKTAAVQGRDERGGELFPSPAGVKPIEGQWATAAQLFAVTGMNDAALRNLANANNPNPATGAAWIPKPRLGKYEIAPTVRGAIAWLQHQVSDQESKRRVEHISYASMESCEGETGITKTLQQMAKQKGCAAFRGPRVYLLDLVRWIFKEAATGNVADWGKLNTELDAKLKQVELDTELRNLITRDEAQRCAQDFAAICFGAIKRLEMECPRDFEMRHRDFIKKAMADKRRNIFKLATEQLERLEKLEPEKVLTTDEQGFLPQRHKA
jgi:hypothetical protein